MTTVSMKSTYPVILCSLILTSCVGRSSALDSSALKEMSKQELSSTIQERDSLITMMSDITQCLDRVNHIENDCSPSVVQKDKRASLFLEINTLESTLNRRREQLSAMERELDSSRENNKQLRVILTEFKNLIDAQLIQIAGIRRRMACAGNENRRLGKRIDSLTDIVSNISLQRDSLQATASVLEHNLNSCYYVVSTKSELKRHGIISTGFLRKSRLRDDDFDIGYFNVADKRSLRNISISSSKVKLLTRHPGSSYRISGTGKTKVLEITNPARFWALSNYLVVQVE